jgi:hypothetical protein
MIGICLKKKSIIARSEFQFYEFEARLRMPMVPMMGEVAGFGIERAPRWKGQPVCWVLEWILPSVKS